MLYKDACNRKSNQQNLGTIRCSNLCTEIVEYTAPDEVAVCNLASIVLPKFVIPLENPAGHNDVYRSPSGQAFQFDLQKLHEVTQVVTRNLNKIIDGNHYPLPEAKRSNSRHRPIGIGVQGLADALQLLHLPFDCAEARRLNRDIFETMYHASLDASCSLAEVQGPYESFAGSPSSRGVLQHDFWGVLPSDRWNWTSLKQRISRFGLRNSLLLAPMPTASTAQILGYNECFEPFTRYMLYVELARL